MRSYHFDLIFTFAAHLKNNFMHGSSDFEKLWFLYKTEGEPKGILIDLSCLTQGVLYRDFNSWFVKTRKKSFWFRLRAFFPDS